MTGLLIKDLKLLLGQKRFSSVVLIFGIFFMCTNENPFSGVGYITMLLSIFTLSTISYDEFENGMSFIMTLPIKRNTYVQEKYLFAGLTTILSSVGSSILAAILGIVRNTPIDAKELIGGSYIIILMAWFVLAIAIPMQIKFGSEKGRIAMMLTLGGLFAFIIFAAKALDNAKDATTDMVTFFDRLGTFGIIALSLVGTALVLGISYLCCVRIINKKEY